MKGVFIGELGAVERGNRIDLRPRFLQSCTNVGLDSLREQSGPANGKGGIIERMHAQKLDSQRTKAIGNAKIFCLRV